ncbi:DUF2141 domain-containing protein [Shewanella psychropiezotolerans]|uniref:DUF2141 domain-containing protein n=1 Tax=Shewanella psychropiezotolerans TaxID=2593655 RepID=A0ABX5WVN1_9GAMM|nr:MULTISPECIES: DUF2141 domain-containing protein [Shewanella]MPY22530.1 DUF2141 domain-containing protein [Shewanella sp. YLB-07]QDO83160.1 DUF2141 domain-containing protein [Shewanella psychropiezotolerans]
MKNIINKSTLTASSIAALVSLLLQPLANADTLTVNLDNIQAHQGSLMVAVYQGEESYSTNKGVVASTKKAVTSESHTLVFTDLAPGEYAIKVMHDENDNGTLDTNFLGIPSEGYGFSNNGGSFGPASYDDAKFTVDGDAQLTIHLR